MNDTEMLDLLQRDDAWLTHSVDDAGTDKEWRCWSRGLHFPSPNIHERAEKIGWGRTAREAVADCFK